MKANKASGYTALANAVIETAARDYLAALKTLKRQPENYQAQSTVPEVERFFESQWFMVLSEVDGPWLKDKLRKEAGYDC